MALINTLNIVTDSGWVYKHSTLY